MKSNNLKNSHKPAKDLELIQQWQAYGEVHPNLMEDRAFEECKKTGVTSLQSYVCWSEIEKEPDVFDFSTYDVLVDKIREHGLKWVPFFILGPYYATPLWFQESDESVYAKCLEHGKETKIQSIWNPFLPKYVDRYLCISGDHYKDGGLLESITLGISGNWGEALYPAIGGFLQQKVRFHTHPGWWCGDEYAISNFRKFVRDKYKSTEELNKTWDTNFRVLEDVAYPTVKNIGLIKHFSSAYDKRFLRDLSRDLYDLRNPRKTISDGIQKSKEKGIFPFRDDKTNPKVIWWLDFVQWYFGSMTDWAEFFIRSARKYFPDTEIYLVTGGDGNPVLGADFSAQARVAAKYNAGIRITNQDDDYANSFILTRLVASSSRFYNSYFTTEEGLYNTPEGVTMRIFDAASSGAKGAYFKTIIHEDTCSVFMRRTEQGTIGEPTKAIAKIKQNLHHLTQDEPIIFVAVLFPNTTVAMDPAVMRSIYRQASRLRSFLDFDLVDENLIIDGALAKYRFLVIFEECLLRQETMTEIDEWVIGGGIILTNTEAQLNIIEGDAKFHCLFAQRDELKKIGNGYRLFHSGWKKNYLKFIKKAVYNHEKKYPWTGIPEIDDKEDGVYATLFANKVLYYNSKKHASTKSIEITNLSEKKNFIVEIEPHSIVSVNTT